MWSKPVTIEAPATEPITLAQAKQFLRVDEAEEGLDFEIEQHVAGARGRIEGVTSTRLIRQTVEIQADSFDDLARFPIGPVISVVDVSYLDRQGEMQTLDLTDFDMVGSGLEMGLILRRGTWPALAPSGETGKGRVRVQAVVGYGDDGAAVPDAVRTGLLLQMRALFDDTVVDLTDWLSNDRIWL